jgi:hypothetical protein
MENMSFAPSGDQVGVSANRPSSPGNTIPRIEGMDSFGGKLFHTSRWDYAYTGGDDRGARMSRIADKNIGIIGNGCTGLQAVPKLALDARHVYVFQRTPAQGLHRKLHARQLQPKRPRRRGPVDYQYPGGQIGFLDDIKRWRDKGELEGLKLTT